MTDYVVGIDRGTNQDSKTLNDICSYLKQCSGGNVTPLGIGPNMVQSYCLGSQAKGKTAVYIANGVGIDTPQDFETGIGRYYHCDSCIFVWPQWIGNQYMSDENILNHIIPREHDFTSVQFGIGSKFTAAQYFSSTKNVKLVSGKSAQDIAQKICGGAFVNSSGNTSTPTSTSSGSGNSNVSPLLQGEMTYEELVGEICNGIDLMFLCKKNTVVVDDFESIYATAKYLRDKKSSVIKGEDIALWQLEEDSYELEINQHGFYNTVYVEYKDGKVRESYEDFVRVYGEIPITYQDKSLDKTSAIMKAKAYLAAHVRDFDMTVNLTMLTEPFIDIGDIVTVENPQTLVNQIRKSDKRDPEYLFVNGLNTSWEDQSYISSDLELKFAPISPEKLDVPSSGTATGNDNSSNNGATGQSFNSCGVSNDGKYICAIGKPSASGESHYGYQLYRSVFERKCPFCGSSELYWGYMWSGNFPCTKRYNNGSAGRYEGHIYCDGCDADFSCIDGKDHMSPPRATLTRADSGPIKCTEQDAYNLRKGIYTI